MLQLLRPILTLLCVSLYFYGLAQTDTTAPGRRPVKPRKTANTTKLDLVYKTANYTSYSSNGSVRSFFVEFPYIRINDAKPVAVDKHGNILRRYYTRAPLANEQLDLMNQQIRRARTQFWLLSAGGVVTAFSGLFAAAANDDVNESVFWTRFGIGGAMIIGGAWLGRYHSKKADKHLRLSVDLYNSRYYKPLPADSVLAAKGAVPAVPSEKKYYKDTVLYTLERNDPNNSGLYGVALHFANVDLDGMNMSIGGGLEAYYTHRSLLGVSIAGYMPYLDAIKGRKGDRPMGFENAGVPSNYQRALRIELQTKIKLVGWEKESSYHITLGSAQVGSLRGVAVGRVKGMKLKALTARLGYQLDNKVVENDNGIPFTTTTPPYIYHYSDGFSSTPQTFPMGPHDGNLSSSAAMMRSNIITAGIGLSTFRDLKIGLNDDTYKGRREEKGQSDLYLDVLYAHSIKFQDITWYNTLPENSTVNMPMRLDISGSPVRKAGLRIGFQQTSMYSRIFGTKFNIEAGIRPGPKMESTTENGYFRITYGILFGGRSSQE